MWLSEAPERVRRGSRGQDGATPFYIAAEKGHAELVRLMLADARIDTNVPKSGEWTPLYTAVQNGHLAVVRMLLGCPRVDVNCTTRVSLQS